MVELTKDDITFEKWDISEDFNSEKDIKRFLNVALEENAVATLELALKEVAKARLRMTKEKNNALISRATLYRQLSGNSKLTVENLFKILDKLNVRLKAI